MEKLVLPASKKIVIEFEGKEHKMSMPTIGGQSEFEESLQALGDKPGTTKLIILHLVRCGLEQSFAEQLDYDQLQAILTVMTPKKKDH